MVDAFCQLVVRHALSEPPVVILPQRPVQHHLQLTCTGHTKENPVVDEVHQSSGAAGLRLERQEVTWSQRRHALTLSRQQSQTGRRVLQERRRCHWVKVGLQGEFGERPPLLHLQRDNKSAKVFLLASATLGKMGTHLKTIEVCVEMVATGNISDKPHGQLVVDL